MDNYSQFDELGNRLRFDELMSVTTYASYRKASGLPGGTRTAVYKALKTGRIATEPNGLISRNKADRMWRESTQMRISNFTF